MAVPVTEPVREPVLNVPAIDITGDCRRRRPDGRPANGEVGYVAAIWTEGVATGYPSA